MFQFWLFETSFHTVAQVSLRLSLCSPSWSGPLALPPECWDPITPGYRSNYSGKLSMLVRTGMKKGDGRSWWVAERDMSHGRSHGREVTVFMVRTRLLFTSFISTAHKDKIAF